MAKVFFHFFALAGAFFGTWFLLSHIPFIDLLHVNEFSRDQERKLGNLIVEQIKDDHREIDRDSARQVIFEIKKRICETNGIVDSTIHIHIIDQHDVNAFALPDRHLVINTGLILYCKTAEELSGVIAHEIAHMEYHHVMKKLTKEVGLAMLITLASGSSSGEIIRETARILSSTAFDREQESEADAAAVQYLTKAEIDPEQLANFLFRLSKEKFDIPKHFEWISTHPNTGDRTAEILKLRKQKEFTTKPLMEQKSWEQFKGFIKFLEQDSKEH
jgi:beta-barrel assembly-enhancing protease